MTLRLILLRHGKSDWSGPATDDFSRPLAERGRRAARLVGAWLAGRGFLPDLVLCSPARRTRETWEELRKATSHEAPLVAERRLYLADAETILDSIRSGGEERTLMVIGHNPGLGVAAEGLLRDPPAGSRFAKYPTGGTTIAAFDIGNWAEAEWGKGRLLAFLDPRELEES